MFLFIFEFLGTSELLIILVVALILFGPRKLPQISRSIGKSLAEFKKASEDFKQTWEKEVQLEDFDKERRNERAMIPEETISSNTISSSTISSAAAPNMIDTIASVEPANAATAEWRDLSGQETIAPVVPREQRSATVWPPVPPPPDDDADGQTAGDVNALNAPTRKRDWL